MNRSALLLAALVASLAACTVGESVVGGRPDAPAADLASPDADASDDALDATMDAVDAAPDADAPDASDASDAMDAPPPDVPSACRADMDCAGRPEGTVCQTDTGRCVPCLPTRDACPVGQFCSGTSCVPGCRNDDACAAPAGDAGVDSGGLPPSRRCDVTTRACVECVVDEHCPSGMLCVGSTCVAGCSEARGCAGMQRCCSGACLDPLSNVASCGGCGVRCTVPNATPACQNGMCTVGACTAPFADCDRMAPNGCEANTLNDAMHCGGCGRACAARPHAATRCDSGRCAFACDAGFADCDGDADNGCEVDLTADPTHCGSCATACNPPNGTPACVMGRCAVGACAAGFGDCDANPTNGCEVDLRVAVSHCGVCGNACPARPNAFPGCLAGRCVTSCVTGFTDCDGDDANGCEVDARTDARNCGGCGRACDPARATGACAAGRCAITRCDDGAADCDRDVATGCEVSLASDARNCGTCGTACVASGGTAACAMGACGLGRCDAGRGNCDADLSNGCEVDLNADARNCGACGNLCDLSNATAACTAGRCAVMRCNDGFADCDGDAANGCEVNLRGDVRNCGRCGNGCSVAGGTPACAMGVCGLSTCAAGRGDCDMSAATGCEVDLNADPRNCGACGSLCDLSNATAACAAGRCAVMRCNEAYADCDADPANGCEVNLRADPTNCGACRNACAAANATPACAAGACAIAACNAGFADCDGRAANGCEVDTRADPGNCGACGSLCDLSNATAACAAGRCAVMRCNEAYADCDANPANGCEVNLRADPRNCGRCGGACAPANGAGACVAGACAIAACNAGFADCNMAAADGCEVLLASDAGNCGACGSRCALANATSACASGRCLVAGCNGGFADCNMAAADGCETNVASTPAACGACGRACSLANTASAGCASGACTVAACVPGFGNCDGSAANGCESNLSSDPANCGACGRVPAEACNLADDNCNGRCDDVGGCRTAVYRSAGGAEHFYTTSRSEASCCGFHIEYDPYYYLYAPAAPGTLPFYRCYWRGPNKHFYTTSSTCEGVPSTNEGVMGYIATGPVCGSTPLYRVYSPASGDHFYTTDAGERDSALRGGYINEGVAGYVWTSPGG